jgi:hypothetical protein
MPWYDELPQDDFEKGLFAKARELEKQGVDPDEINDWFQNERRVNAERRAREREQEAEKPKPLPTAENVRVSEREKYRKKCQVDRYAVMKSICPRFGMQAHHIVPDWTLRYGSRNSGDRIPNMPSLNDGMAICVLGMARTSGTEHNQGHFADAAIEGLGKNAKPPFTAPLSDVVRESAKAMIRVRPDCAKQITAALVKQFGPKKPNQLLRAKQYPPLPALTIKALKSGATKSSTGKP